MLWLCTLLGWILGITMMGHTVPTFLPRLLPILILLCVALLGISWRKYQGHPTIGFKIVHILICTLSSFCCAFSYANHALQQRLENRVTQMVTADAIVYIAKINQLTTDEQGQKLKQQATLLNAASISKATQPIQLLLRVKSTLPQPELELGQYYRVQGKVHPAQSYAVPGAFDLEKWYLQNNVMGTLQVQQIAPLSRTEVMQLGYHHFIQTQDRTLAKMRLMIERQRLHFRRMIAQQPLSQQGLVLALLTGDESLLSKSTQDLFKRLGISHLLAISGPHVLIFAVIVCFILLQLIQRIQPNLYLKYPRPYVMVIPFLLCVWLYSAFVGFEIPALRTLLTVTLIGLMLLLQQQISALKLLLWSASLLLLYDPFSILSAAFWLSYGACFILIRVYQTIQHHPEQKAVSWWGKIVDFSRILFESQWKIFIALLPLVILIFQQVSWLAPLSNLLAIPLIGAVIVPLDVMAALLSYFSESLSLPIFHLADLALQLLLYLLKFIDLYLHGKLYWQAMSSSMMLCFMLAIVIVFLPRGVIPKAWAFICMIPLFFPKPLSQAFELTVLDVGQGQAIFLNIEQHKMLIDTGGYYDEQKFSVAEQILIPYLMRRGIKQLDQVLLSHLDQDHSGAFTGLNNVIAIDQVYSNEKDKRFDATNFNYCHAGQKWQFNQVSIAVLSPSKESLSRVHNHQNELSCIVYIRVPQANQYQNFLIMGDAGWETEYQLLQQYPDLKVDVLVLGHHGSRHSSSFDFLQHFKPKLAIVSAGLNNRYGHPHPIVLQRLAALSIPVKSTMQHGSIRFQLNHQGQMQFSAYRDSRLWLQR